MSLWYLDEQVAGRRLDICLQQPNAWDQLCIPAENLAVNKWENAARFLPKSERV